LLNGHIDAVSAEPISQWETGPFDPVIDGERLYGRGACDMKGGLAAIVIAVESLKELGIDLRGDVYVNAVTDEESSGAGALATLMRGIRADGVIVPEPSGLEIWTACRGIRLCELSVKGRAGHAEVAQAHWSQGGAVNAIDKALPLLTALGALRQEWRSSEQYKHPMLSFPDAVPTVLKAGEWEVSYPTSCSTKFDVTYLPGQADASGWGSDVDAALLSAITEAAKGDDWLQANPPEFSGFIDLPPSEVDSKEEVVCAMQAATVRMGLSSPISGLDSWYDGATFAHAGIPSIAFGPGSIETAHTVGEFVIVDELVTTAQALALAAVEFCS